MKNGVHHNNGNGGRVVMTRAQVEALAERQAKNLLGLNSSAAAFKQLEQGKLAGKLVEAEFKMLRDMLHYAK